MKKPRPEYKKAIADLRSKQRDLITDAAKSGALPSWSMIVRISELEDEIFGLEHVRDYEISHRRA